MERAKILSIINSRNNNNLYRKVCDKQSPMYAYDTQIETAKEVVVELCCDGERNKHVMLVSPMQGGKTGTINSVVNIIQSTKLNRMMNVNKYFFITGMNDCGLKEQTLERIYGQVIDANESNVYYKRKHRKDHQFNRYYLLKNSDLLEYEGVIDNSVIFVDEAHYGSGEKHILTQFFEKHQINWKSPKALKRRNIYIVSVSATSFDELISDTIDTKKMVILKTDEDYVGVTDYLENDCIIQASKEDMDGPIFDYIDDALERMDSYDENGIIFIRTTKYDIIEGSPYAQICDIYEMDSSNSKIQYQLLDEKIDALIASNETDRSKAKPLLVLIKGAFRAGMTIKAKYKDLVYMVYDYSLKADTTAQALLGRMCGYRHGHKDITKCLFYINLQCAEQYSNWEKDFLNKSAIPSDKMEYEWLPLNYDGPCRTEIGSKSLGNFYIPLSDEECLAFHALSKRTENKESKLKSLFESTLSKYGHGDFHYDYLMESYLGGKNHYAKSSQIKRWDMFSSDSNVFIFRPNKIKQFMEDYGRDYLTREDIGKSSVVLVLDCNIIDDRYVTGNKRLLVYHSGVLQKRLVASRKKQYKPHKDTNLV